MKLKAFVSAATAAAFGFVLCTAAPASAKGGGPKPKVASGKPAGGGGPKGGTSVKGGGPKGGAPKGGGVAKGGAPKGSAPKGSAKPGKAPSSPGSTKGSASKGSAPSSAAGKRADKGTPTPSSATLNHAQQLLTKNTNLRENMQSRLPAGMDAIAAASDFRNLGQFVAAVNASHNQGYDFLQLKALMTGPEALSLGQAKKRLRAGTPLPVPGPDANVPPSSGSVPPPGTSLPGPDANVPPSAGVVPGPPGSSAPGSDATTPPTGTSASKTKGRKSQH